METTTELKNAIFTIYPYKDRGVQWCFDDEATGLVKEAFVAGADTLLDKVCEGKEKCIALFSPTPFPGHTLTLEKVHEDEFGTDFYCKEYDHDLWLCPAAWLYIKPSPDVLYVQIKPQ